MKTIKITFRRKWITASVAVFALAVFVSVASISAAETTKPAKPNIVFILADDLGYGDLSCYGQKKFETPNIDRLAKEGMRFTQFYAGATVCSPSRCALMTGLHNGHASVRGNKEVAGGEAAMPTNTLTVAKLLQQAGYKTAVIGKWGLGKPGSTSDPLKMGFDYYFGYDSQNLAHHYYPDHLWRNDQRVELPENKDGKRGAYSHDLFETDALKFIAENQQQPFFLYLALTIPHAELLVPEDSLKSFAGKWPEAPFSGGGGGKATYHATDTPRAAFAAMITRMDRTVGRIADELKRLHLDENTVVIFTSDNGPHLEGGATPDFFDSSGGLRGYKRDLYEGGIRVPFIARWPKHIAAGQTNDLVGYSGDFFATAGDMVGQPIPGGLDSVSFLPTLLGNTAEQKPHEFLFWEFYERQGARAIRKGNWKAVRPTWSAPVELYDLSKDSGERNNLAAGHPEIVKELTALMEEQHRSDANWPPPSNSKSNSE